MSGAASGAHEKLSFNTVNITQGGYVYVYLSNEGQTGFDVYFDDLNITHTKGAILQEDHYYPFGLSIAALSSTAPLSKPNKFKFNGIEETTDFDLNTYDAFFRNYDLVLGRWWQIDPKAHELESPYAGMGNNPILYSDILGDTIRVTNTTGDFLFSLDDGLEDLTTTTARDLYDQGTQWFEPEADNYMPLLKVSESISDSDGLKHFSWKDIAEFADKNFGVLHFVQGGDGDWKSQKEGADGFFLVTVGGQPYWADAVGNIVFGVWAYKETGSVKESIVLGFQFDDGSVFNAFDNGKNFNDKVNNHYDIYAVVRGALFGKQQYHSIGNRMYEPTGRNTNPKMLGNPLRKKLFKSK